MTRYDRHCTIWNGRFTIFPYWYDDAENYDVLISDLSDNFTCYDSGATIVTAYESETKKIVGYSIKHYGIEIETSTFDKENELEILEFLVDCSNPKYIIRDNIKDNELQVYKKLGYDVDSNVTLLVRKKE